MRYRHFTSENSYVPLFMGTLGLCSSFIKCYVPFNKRTKMICTPSSGRFVPFHGGTYIFCTRSQRYNAWVYWTPPTSRPFRGRPPSPRVLGAARLTQNTIKILPPSNLLRCNFHTCLAAVNGWWRPWLSRSEQT